MSPNTLSPAGGRSAAIDFLRGAAILLVLGCHFVIAPEDAGFLAPLAKFWRWIGWVGVDLFFVLSGYLVSGLLFAEYQRNQRIDLPRFLIRRGLKIWPAYFVYLAFLAAWLFWQARAHDPVAALQPLWPNIFHVQNYLGTPRTHTWSLAVEEHFYLAGALLAAFFLRRERIRATCRIFPLVALAGLVSAGLARFAGFTAGGYESLNLFATHLRSDGLLVGTLAAYYVHFEPARVAWIRRHALAGVIGGIALAAPALALNPHHGAWVAGFGLSFMYVGFAVVTLGLVNLEKRREWRDRFARGPAAWLARIGFFSYSIYLWHVDLAQTPMKKLGLALAGAGVPAGAAWFVTNLSYVLVAAIAGIVMARLIEIPTLAFRDRFFPARTTNPPVSPAVPPTTGPLPAQVADAVA